MFYLADLCLKECPLGDQLPVLLLKAAQLLALRGRGPGSQRIHLPINESHFHHQSINHTPIVASLMVPSFPPMAESILMCAFQSWLILSCAGSQR
jgi:hypothetical protein